MIHTLRTTAMLALAGAFAVSLTACNGGGSSIPGVGTNVGYFRFVNASADAGPVDIFVDGQHVNGPGTNGVIPYGGISPYIQYNVGQHTIIVNAGGTQTALTGIPSSSLTQSVNGNSRVTLALVGEQHPTQQNDTLNLIATTQTNLYSTPGGGFAVDFYHDAPALGSGGVQFGYYYVNTPSTLAPLGSPISPGQQTNPQGLPSAALNANTQVGFYAGSPSQYTLLPSQVDSTGCAANTLPCNSGNSSVYAIDGPAASTTPVAGPYPQGVKAGALAGLVGIFDANNT